MREQETERREEGKRERVEGGVWKSDRREGGRG